MNYDALAGGQRDDCVRQQPEEDENCVPRRMPTELPFQERLIGRSATLDTVLWQHGVVCDHQKPLATPRSWANWHARYAHGRISSGYCLRQTVTPSRNGMRTG
jgi:hypothetical protein